PAQAASILKPVAVDPQLTKTVEAITSQAAAGYRAERMPVLSPRSVTVTRDQAQVRDCQDGSNTGVWDKSGAQLRKGKPDTDVLTTLKLVDGSWRVMTTEYPPGHPSGYCS